jgi:hypothetical protein
MNTSLGFKQIANGTAKKIGVYLDFSRTWVTVYTFENQYFTEKLGYIGHTTKETATANIQAQNENDAKQKLWIQAKRKASIAEYLKAI